MEFKGSWARPWPCFGSSLWMPGSMAARNEGEACEYDARKRLYEEVEPLLFQLFENANHALNRIRNLARASRDGQLESWLAQQGDSYYLRSTLHSFLVPLASIHLIRD